MDHKVFIIVGPSGSGKSTVVEQLKKTHGFYEHISHTTRQMRPNEKPGKTYHFVTDSEFDSIVMLESAIYGGNKYGVAKNEFIRNMSLHPVSIIVTEIQGAEAIQRFFPHNSTSIFIEIKPEQARKNMLKRGDSADTVLQRFQHDCELDVFSDYAFTDYTVVNDSTIDALGQDILAIIKEETSRTWQLAS